MQFSPEKGMHVVARTDLNKIDSLVLEIPCYMIISAGNNNSGEDSINFLDDYFSGREEVEQIISNLQIDHEEADLQT